MAGVNRKRKWENFRREVIELDGSQCVRCGKSPDTGAVLHVHHKSYMTGRDYWDYPLEMMETLCAGCHAKEHDIITPDCGWSLTSEDDLGGRVGTCDYCGNSLRYTFHVHHPSWPAMNVGSDCCDQLTGTGEASKSERQRHNRESRRQRFIESGGWALNDDGAQIKFAFGYRIRLAWEPDGYRIYLGVHRGSEHHPTIAEAKGAAFDGIEWLANRRERRS